MGFNRFSLMLAVRLIFIMVALAITGLLFVTPGFHAGTLLAALVSAGLTWEVVGFVSRTNQELSRFLDAARYADFGQRFEFAGMGAGFSELGDTFTHIMDRFREDRRDQESELRHLKALLEHVPVPLISIYSDGSLTLWNNAARRLFGTGTPSRLEDLEAYGVELQKRLVNIKAGDRFLADFRVDGMGQRLTVSASEITLAGRAERLVSLQNIQSELDGVQLSAWQDLVRVLTHEIMNSITPVASLARTAADLVEDARQKLPADNEVSMELMDAKDAVDTLARRSDSLMDFVTSYRQMTRLPEPEMQPVRLQTLFHDVSLIATADWQAQGISFLTSVEPEQLEVTADIQMLEQVLINLLQNAAQTLSGRPSASVIMRAGLNPRGHVTIEVSDNGPGVPEEILDSIFVPFYTTRRDGSGVGLALSRQIMIAHGGNISCSPSAEGGARFTLIF
jgi:nitrogen fixation/metabolism regulation signal transduction histidine kinase